MGNSGSSGSSEVEVETETEKECKVPQEVMNKWLRIKERALALQKKYTDIVQGIMGPVSTTNLELLQQSTLMFSNNESQLPELLNFVEKNKKMLHTLVDEFAAEISAHAHAHEHDEVIAVYLETLTPMYALFINLVLAVLNRQKEAKKGTPLHIAVWDAGVAAKKMNEWNWIITAAASFNTKQNVKVHYAEGSSTGVHDLQRTLLGLGKQITKIHEKNGKPAAVFFYETIMNLDVRDKVLVKQMTLELHVNVHGDHKLNIDFHTEPYDVPAEFAEKTGFEPKYREEGARDQDIESLTASVTAFLKLAASNGKHGHGHGHEYGHAHGHGHAHGYSRRLHGQHPPTVSGSEIETGMAKMKCYGMARTGNPSKIETDTEKEIKFDDILPFLTKASNDIKNIITEYGDGEKKLRNVPKNLLEVIKYIKKTLLKVLALLLLNTAPTYLEFALTKEYIGKIYSLLKSIPVQALNVEDVKYDEEVITYQQQLKEFEEKYQKYLFD